MNLSTISTGGDAHPPVCILMLNWNGKKHLEYALPSVLATDYPNYELVVIDNASTDGSVKYIEENLPKITVLRNERNLQYAAGNNVGVRYAMERGAKYVALLNNDVKVDQRWLAAAVQVAEERPQVGCVGFRVFNEYRDEDRDGRQFETAMDTWQELEVTETKHICGCALFIRTEVFERIGFFDEVFVAYGEEDDFEKRAMRVGYKMVRVNVPIWHYSMGSWGKMPLHAGWLVMRNTIRCAIKNDDSKCILNIVKRVFVIACNPFSKADPVYFHYMRLRPSNVAANSFLLGYALLWNLVFLPQTLAARKRAQTNGARTTEALE